MTTSHDKYDIIRRISVGGMGEIFLARQLGAAGFNRLVVLKTLRPELAEQTKFVEQFLDEARLAAMLNHANVVAVYDVGEWEGSVFIAMEFIRGVPLTELMTRIEIDPFNTRRDNGMPWPIAARIVADAAVGLDHAHNARGEAGYPLGIVHRDISPHNIMVSEDGVTKVVDFGIAKAAIRWSKTATGTLKGKLNYMAPEQLEAGPLDGRCDQFALGIVLWELCTGRRLFQVANPVEAAAAIAGRKIDTPAAFFDGFPPDLEAIIMKMLNRDREARFDRCLDVSRSLEIFLEGAGTGSHRQTVAAYINEVAGERIAALADTGESSPPGGKTESVSQQPRGLAALRAARPSRQRMALRALSQLTPFSSRPNSARLAWLVAALALSGVAWLVFDRFQSSGSPAVTSEATVAADSSASTQKVEFASLALDSDPQGAAVHLDGEPKGGTPLQLKGIVARSRHRIDVTLAGFEPKSLEIELAPGERATRRLLLVRRHARRAKTPHRIKEPISKEGTLTLHTEPWTTVSIGGRPFGSTPLFEVRLPAGKHLVKMINEPAGIDLEREVEVIAGRLLRVRWQLGGSEPASPSPD